MAKKRTRSGTTYLALSALHGAATYNARRPYTGEGPRALLSFMSGLVTSELPRPAIAVHLGEAAYAALRGDLRTRQGKAGLVVSAASVAGLWQIDRQMQDAPQVVEQALVDELGADHASRRAPRPMEPRPGLRDRVVPSPRWRRAYVGDGHISYGEHGRRNTLDVWRRPDLPRDGRAPVLLQIHGGGWMTGDKQGQAYPLMGYLAERGWVCVSATYRLSPRSTWPDHVVDVKRALGWVKENIADHGGDPDWVAITGGSAGGHLTALTALTPNDPQFQPGFEDVDTTVRAAVPFYGVYDWTNRDGTGKADLIELLERHVLKAPFQSNREIYEQASPMTHVRADAPPFFFLHGSSDSLVPVAQARAMAEMLRKESTNPVVYAEFPGAQHAFDVFGSPRTLAAVEGVEAFLDVCRATT